MPASLALYYRVEIDKYRKAFETNNLAFAWHHLERAHIIGQRYPWQHSEAHWKMLCLSIKERKPGEIVGQLIRLIFGAPLSVINLIPFGNVGSTRVSMTKPQTIPQDIAKIFAAQEKN